MKALPPNTSVPWQVRLSIPLLSPKVDLSKQRVIGSTGYISPRGDSGLGAERQMERLREEGVEAVDVGAGGVGTRGGGRFRVDVKRFGWFPEVVGEEA